MTEQKELAMHFQRLAETMLSIATALNGDKPLAAANGTGYASVAAGAIADDRELDSDKGDPEVRKDPKRWNGESMVGRRYSECRSEFLEVLASFKEWSAANPREGADPKYADYDRRDAARARGWARRNGGKSMPATAAPMTPPFGSDQSLESHDGMPDDGIPF